MAGASFHGVDLSPRERGVYALEQYLENCSVLRLVLRKNQQANYFTLHDTVTANVYAAWSPDGSKVVFARGAGDPYQVAIALWNDDPKRIAWRDLPNGKDLCSNIAHNSSGITWDFRSQWVYFSACPSKDSPTQVVRVEVHKDGSEGRRQVLAYRQLSQYKYKAYPAPSPSGRQVAFTAGSDTGSWTLYVLDISPSAVPKKLLPDNWGGSDHHFVLNPSWRPEIVKKS